MDYEKLGFKCGIEIHQQLSGLKLFCDCPAINSSEKPNICVERRLRAVIGETGDIDIAAAYETAKSKKFIYLGDSADVCDVELDEEHPHPINQEAVKTALIVAKMLNARIVDEVQVMRKIVVDGSNVTGFQRTALVGYGGYIDTSKGKVGIPVILLEEEACQKIKTANDSVTYRLDRLGMSMLEIATDASIKDNIHAKEAAEKIGMILRSTGRVKRGIGTIRQDVNVSIKGRSRVEMKGFQDLRSIPAVIENEIKRLLGLKKTNEPEVRKVEPDGTTSFLRPLPGAARMYPETDVLPFKPDISKVEAVELIEEKVKRFERLGLGKDLAKFIAKSERADLFFDFIKRFKKIKPAFIAETLVSTTKELKRQGIDADKITDKQFEGVFEALNTEKISKESIMAVLSDAAKGTLDLKKYYLMSDKELEKEIKKIVSENKDLPFKALIGKAMAKVRGKASGKKIAEFLRKYAN
ncbi:Glu-tRNA(Gln) amidotransferase subunit GatE [Candidatus Woesearchaeota archaeon]|nr:Glu-tRNA(Gln) amidotransferase subunit GatE [Candidatus Woesearchaeota archaeon]